MRRPRLLWGAWSLQALESSGANDALAINSVVYAEVSIAFSRIEELEQVLVDGGLAVMPCNTSHDA
jgi:hypothetical protein